MIKVTNPRNILAFLFIRFAKISSNPNVTPINTDAIIIKLKRFKLKLHIGYILFIQSYLFIIGDEFSL